jgi:NADPH2:quinone reductase
VGLACLQLAESLRVTVYGTAGSSAGEALVSQNGADFCFNHNDPSHFDAVKKVSGDKGVNLIVEMLADVNLDSDLKVLGQGGRVVVVGSRGRIEISPRDLMSVEGDILGMKMPFSSHEEKREYARVIAEGIAAGRIRPPIQAVYAIDGVQDAHRDVIAGPHLGNLVILI